MNDRRRRRLLIAALVAVVGAALGLGSYIFFPGLPASVKVYDVVSAGNVRPAEAWTAEKRQWYYHVSEGSQLMPYSWFLALEQPDGREPFLSPDYITRFRVLPDVNPLGNPDRLPLGFARDFPGPEGEASIGITCAGCHTAQLNYKGLGLRIDGAPGQLDLTRFLDRLAAALLATDVDAVKFDRFARRVLGGGYGAASKAQLRSRVRGRLAGRLAATLQQWNLGEDSALEPTEPGFGRIDALGQGGNTLFGKLSAANLRRLDAPVNVIPLWNANRYGWVQSNASIRQPMARNVIQALSVSSFLDLRAGPTQYASSVRLAEMARMEEVAASFVPPQWPEWLFGALDPGKVTRGRALYGRLCAGCHAPQLEDDAGGDGVAVVPGPYPPDPVTLSAGERFYHLRLFDLDAIGTDPNDALNFADRTVDARALGFTANEPGPRVIYAVVSGILDRYYREHGVSEAQQASWSGYRANYWRAPRGYPARPLAGVWATAPYLHNGSVPNLYELLTPADERSAKFYLGNPEFDPLRVGFESGRFYGGLELDTSRPGNSNAGHELRDGEGKGVIGPRLSETERWDLIEFLKALRFEDEAPAGSAPPPAVVPPRDDPASAAPVASA
jgi:cytochrome c5